MTAVQNALADLNNLALTANDRFADQPADYHVGYQDAINDVTEQLHSSMAEAARLVTLGVAANQSGNYDRGYHDGLRDARRSLAT